MTNKQIGWGLGILALAVVGVVMYNKRKSKAVVTAVKKDVKEGEEKSGFIINSGNAGRKKCVKNGGTVVFTANGSECV